MAGDTFPLGPPKIDTGVIAFGQRHSVGVFAASPWVFVLVKLVVVSVVVVGIREEFERESQWGSGLLVAVITAGLGPAVHNVVVFASPGLP